MSTKIWLNFEKFSSLPKEEKYQLLIDALKGQPRGTKARMARYCRVGQRQISFYLKKSSWPPADKEERLWKFMMHLLHGIELEESAPAHTPTVSEETEAYVARFRSLMDKNEKIRDHLRRQIILLEQLDTLERRTGSQN